MYAVIFWLFMWHSYVTNAMEKLAVQACIGTFRRPDPLYRNTQRFKSLGMPSGHAECAMLTVLLLYAYRIISMPFAIYEVLVVCLQRIYTLRHTVPQVVVGSMLGALYAVIYWNFPAYAVAVSILIPVALLVAATVAVSYQTFVSPPEWIDHRYIKNTPFHVKLIRVAKIARFHRTSLFCSWSDLEGYLNTLVDRIDDVDIVVGLDERGSAMVGKYIAKKLEIPFLFENRVTTINLINKRVLVIDAFSDDADKLRAVQNYLLTKKGVAKVQLACVAISEVSSDILVATDEWFAVSPWG